MEHRTILLDKINSLLEGHISFKEFEAGYYNYYLEEVPEGVLSEKELDFFGEAHEKLDWTDENPNEESRGYGWIDQDEYVEWLRKKTKEFLAKSEAV